VSGSVISWVRGGAAAANDFSVGPILSSRKDVSWVLNRKMSRFANLQAVNAIYGVGEAT